MVSSSNYILPNVFIGGAQKSGTTYLHNVISQHPNIFIPKRPQEIHFFDTESNYKKGLTWYSNLFKNWQGESIIAQTAPSYIYEPIVPERIKQVINNPKFIFILRNPIYRAYSHYWHSIKYGFEYLSFEEAIKQESERITKNFKYRSRYSYLDRGKYFEQIKRFNQYFGAENILIILFDDLKLQVEKVVEDCNKFLGLDSYVFNPDKIPSKYKNKSRLPKIFKLQRLNSLMKNTPLHLLSVVIDKINLRTATYPVMELKTKEKLQKYFYDDIISLQNLINKDLSSWLN